MPIHASALAGCNGVVPVSLADAKVRAHVVMLATAAGAVLVFAAGAAVGAGASYKLRESLEALRSQEREVLRRHDIIQEQIAKLEGEKSALEDYLRQIDRARRDIEQALSTTP